MQTEAARLLSFSEGWPQSSPVRPADLARAGLYRMGFSDLVACFRCGGTMHHWEPGDDPAREHAKHFPACALMAPLPPATQDGADSALGPEMRSFRARIRSFASWPNTANVSPRELAYAGFYYSDVDAAGSSRSADVDATGSSRSADVDATGSSRSADVDATTSIHCHGDLVRCFSCDGHLQGWSLGDSAWHEHAKWFPSCAFVERQKGEDFVRKATRPPARLPGQTPQRTTAEIEHAAPSTAELLDKLEERLSCKVCMDHEVSTMFVPCGHVVTCTHCALSLSQCPVCRVPVNTALRAFMA